jgi:uncharacterized membrane protein HdeD (DUF308 family)
MIKNVGNMDRIIRLVGGIVLLLLGLFVPMTLGLAILFVVLGVLLIVTGALQYCPLYSVLKLSTKK